MKFQLLNVSLALIVLFTIAHPSYSDGAPVPIDPPGSLALSNGPETGPEPFPVFGALEAPQSVTVSGDTECPECAARAEGDPVVCLKRVGGNLMADIKEGVPCLFEVALGLAGKIAGGAWGFSTTAIGTTWGAGKTAVTQSAAFIESTASGVANAGGT